MRDCFGTQVAGGIGLNLRSARRRNHLVPAAAGVIYVLMASGLKPTGTKICARLIFVKKLLIGHCVSSCPDLPPSFLKEVQSFVKVLFTAGQAILQSHDHDAFDNDNNGVDNHNVVNKFKISVLTNAVCVDILVWAARDEQGRTQPTSDPSSKS